MPIGLILFRPSLSSMMMKIMPHLRIVVTRKRVWHDEAQGAELLLGPKVSLVELQGTFMLTTFMLTGTPGVGEKGKETAGTFLGVWRPSMTGKERGPPALDPTPNVPPFPNITFGGPLHQRAESMNRDTGSSRITERAANVVEAGARDDRLANALEIEDSVDR